MKAPDKIYLFVEKGEDWAYAMWTPKSPEEQKFSEIDEHEEYIRKDALLEWLEQNRNQAQMWFDKYCEKEDLSAKQVWEEVIAKINEL